MQSLIPRLSNFGKLNSLFSVLLLAVCLLRDWKFVAGLCRCAFPAEAALMATYVTGLATCLIVRSLTIAQKDTSLRYQQTTSYICCMYEVYIWYTCINMVAPENRQRLHMLPYGMAEDGWFAALGFAPLAPADKGCVTLCNCFLMTQFTQYFKFVNMNLSAFVHLASLLN